MSRDFGTLIFTFQVVAVNAPGTSHLLQRKIPAEHSASFPREEILTAVAQGSSRYAFYCTYEDAEG
jgi:hypothetical protein